MFEMDAPMFSVTPYKLAVMAAALLASRGVLATIVSVSSTNDGAGYYQYVIACGTEPFFFGGMNTALTVTIPSQLIVTASASPGWQLATNATAVTARYLGTFVIGDVAAVTVAITSASITSTLYDEWSTTGMYPRGWVIGEVYTTNNALYAPVTSNAVTSVNVVGYARFALVGPQVPEPVGALLLLGICAMNWRGTRGPEIKEER